MKQLATNQKIKMAIDFAKKHYGDKTDGSGTLIFDHCFRVFFKLLMLLKDSQLKSKDKKDIMIAGLFHDLIEDTTVNQKEILFFGKKVLIYTQQMTINFSKGIKNAVKPLYKIDDEVFLIKLSDISDNVNKSFFMVRKNGLRWYYDFFLPLLNEYQLLIEYKRKNLKDRSLKAIIDSFSDEVLEKISELKDFIDFNKKLSICK